MNWLKTLWSSLIAKTSTSPKLSVVKTEEITSENQPETAVEIFVRILLDRGLNMREISVCKMDELYSEWYEGPATEEAVLESIPAFKSRYSISFAQEGEQ
jgi:hypothetical protein